MSECRGRLETVSAFVDGELSPDEELELRRHFEVCEACAAWRRQLEALSAGVASSLGRERASRALARQIARLAPRRRLDRVGISGLAAAAVLAIALAVSLHGRELSPDLFVDDHRELISGRTALSVVSSDPGRVARDLGEQLPFGIALEPVAGAELRGGHACSLRGKLAAYLQYVREGQPVSVFVIPGSVRTGAAPGRCEQVGDESLCAFAGSHETLAVVASSPDLARPFRGAARVVGSH